MFPQIAKRKRKDFVFEEPVTRQAEEALRDLDLRIKAALKRIPPQILQDFSKVCRVKSIPEFYAHYFITSTQRTDPQKLSEVYAEEIERLLTNSSHFHRINQALRQREELIEGLRNSLAVVEGFLLMNQNKPVPLQMKAEIDGMVSECASLEELKELQRKKTEAMAMDIIRVRTNTTQLVELVQEWRKDLNQLAGDGGRKSVALYPHQGINCLLMPLYDLLFLRASSLKAEFSFGKDEHDPFLERITKSKRGSQIQQYLLDYLKADTTDYSPHSKAIMQELPSDQAEKQKEREAELQRQKQERAKEQKLKEEKLKSLRQEKDKNVRVRHYSSLKSLKQTQPEKARTLTIKTSKGERTDRKIINVDKLIFESKKKQKQPLSQNQSKILGVYKKGKRQSMENSSVVEREQVIQEKRLWEKSMKQEREEKQKIRKQLRQTEKRALQETKQFEQKLKRYEEEVHNLKSRIEQSKKQGRVLSSKASPTPSKNKKELVISAYRSQRSGRGNLGAQALQSKLQEQSKNKQYMQKQIKQLAKQKQKLQRLIGKESVRATKEVEISRRQIEKYQEVIAKLKNETEESRRIIQELQLSKISEENKQADAVRDSKVKQKAEQLKRAAELRVEEKQKAAKVVQQRKKESLQQSHSKKRHSLTSSRANPNTSQVRANHPEVQTLKSRLQQQSRDKRSLQSQIRQLGQQKARLERLIEKESFKSAKEQQRNNRRIQKYQQTINRLKKQSEGSRKIISQIQSSKIAEERKEVELSKIEIVRKKEEELKRKIQQKIEERERRKQIQKSKVEELQRSRGRQQNGSLGDDVEIIKTKQTIEIVFEPRRKRAHRSKELLQSQSKLARLEKQRELLEKKLEMSAIQKKEKTQQQRALAKAQTQKLQARAQEASQRLRLQVEKQRAKNGRLQQNLKKVRASISNEYQIRLNQEKLRFQREREQLLRTIERQREEKRNKDKVLQQQMSFLKQMEKKEHELFDLLQSEKREKARKQQILAREIEQKEELINIMQLEQIKKSIQREVRRQIEENSSQEEDDFQHQQRKAELQHEIEQLRLEKQQELEEMNGQNEKLKDLIAQLKAQENQLLEAIKENIEMESESEREDIPPPETPEEQAPEPVTNQSPTKQQTLQELQQSNQQLQKELHSKTLIQFKNEEKTKLKYSHIANSQDFHQKQKIENLVEYYLKSPADYPGDKQQQKEKERGREREAKLKDTEKREIIEGSAEKARMIQQFQSELFSLRQLPDFVPTIKNDSVNSHLLNLREVYQDYEADSLRRELFPPLQQEVYGEQLSEDDPEPPMNTIMDHVRAHLHKYPAKKEDKGKKNFLAINRVRLAVLQDARKEKQRQIIEEQSKKRIQRELFEKRRKEREENFIRERQKENQLKEQKRQEAYRNEKARLEKQRLSNEKRQQERSLQKKRREQQKRQSSGQKKKPSKQSQKHGKKSKRKGKRHNQSDSDHSRSDNETNKKGKNQNLEPQMLPIKEEHPEQSLEQQQAELAEQVQQYEEELQKREKEVLKNDIKQVQQEVRAYIKEQQQFNVYQQFVNQAELLARIKEILDLSSVEIRNLNSNQTILEDIQLYSVLTLLVAKNSKGLQMGLGVFHKELQTGQYVCDYLLAHNMENFLNLAFNFSRFLFQNDPYANKNEFIFDIKSVTDTQTLRHFLQFQKKCRRLGEVYIKAQSQTQRKYVLRRALFQAAGDKPRAENGGAHINLKLSLCGNLLTQINEGFKNKSNFNYSSFNLITAYYLSRKQKKLLHFREKAQTELVYREILVTALLFQKKQLQIKNFTLVEYGGKDIGGLSKMKDKFDLADVEELDEMAMLLSQKLPQSVKRCTLEVALEQVNYLLISPEEAVTSIQSSNSSQTGYFLSIIPKYKLMVIEAEEYLTMSGKNPDLTAFFYIKHFIKNIVDVKKEKYDRVYLPELQLKNEFHFPDLSKRLGETVFLSENMEIGWKSKFPNSVLYTPRHQDLVIQKPFIVALLSGPVERAVEGSPICVQLIV